MLLSLVLSGLFLMTHAPGWSMPIITEDMWSYSSQQRKTIQVTGTDTLHQAWNKFNQESRIGYKVYLPDGTVLFPETMVSNDVGSTYTTGCLVNEESVAVFWRVGAPAWYCIRDSSGSELVPTSLLIPDSYVNRPRVEASSDSLGRIHASFEISDGVCYAVFEPGVGEVFRDTVPGSLDDISNICVDGTRVHIIYTAGFDLPAYIQYDLEGNIVIPPVELVQGLVDLSPTTSVTVDGDGNFWCFFYYATEGATSYVLSIVKVDSETGDVLVLKEIETPNLGAGYMNILPGPDGDTLYLMWLAYWQSDHYVYFAIIDKDGNFIEEPYAAYDYSDEEVQQIASLEAAVNEDGDVFAIWSQGDVEVSGYWIVMGWFDHDWVEVEESGTVPVDIDPFVLQSSANPFTESVTITVQGTVVPDQLVIYDFTGRIVRIIPCSSGNAFLWDGCDSEGNELPAGAYTIHGISACNTAFIQVVKL
ncbi:MAG: hypothetical protein KAH31_06905 [Candidatus Sabulitectum sp.]|nr:hypothetical protein [Candidatus Sabulitectum sp.]